MVETIKELPDGMRKKRKKKKKKRKERKGKTRKKEINKRKPFNACVSGDCIRVQLQ